MKNNKILGLICSMYAFVFIALKKIHDMYYKFI